jgi:hypothetical protein
MRVRLERNVRSCATRSFSRLIERECLRVFDVVVNVEAFTDDLLSIVYDHATDQRSGADKANAARCQFQRPADHPLIQI